VQSPAALPCCSCIEQHRLQKLSSGGELKGLGPTGKEKREHASQWFEKQKGYC